MATWGDYTLRDILDNVVSYRPDVIVRNQPTDTSANNVRIDTNIIGYGVQVQRLVDGEWVGGAYTTTNSDGINVSLSSITTTSICRIAIFAFGTNKDTPVYTNEFTVTRTAGQAQSLKQDVSEVKTETVEDVPEDVTVEKDVVAAKTTTSTKK